MKDLTESVMRQAFERVSAPNFSIGSPVLTRNDRGEYTNPVLEDHWQTFQEGWECAIELMKQPRRDSKYSDIVSNGGMDPR